MRDMPSSSSSRFAASQTDCASPSCIPARRADQSLSSAGTPRGAAANHRARTGGRGPADQGLVIALHGRVGDLELVEDAALEPGPAERADR